MNRRISIPFVVLSGCFVFLFILIVSGNLMLPAGMGMAANDRALPPLPLHKPKRIVSLTPGNTEILFALGAGDRIVGVSSFSDYPPEAKAKPVVGAYNAPDVEKIISLEPDIIFAARSIHNTQLDILRGTAIKIVEVEPQNMQEILESIILIGDFIGEQGNAHDLTYSLNTRLQNIKLLSAELPRRKVFLEIWGTPLMTVGTKSHISDMIYQAGGINAINRQRDYTTCDIETLYAANPDIYIVLTTHNSSKSLLPISLRPGYTDLPAIKNGRIASITDDLVARPGPRSFDGLEKIFQLIHPEISIGK